MEQSYDEYLQNNLSSIDQSIYENSSEYLHNLIVKILEEIEIEKLCFKIFHVNKKPKVHLYHEFVRHYSSDMRRVESFMLEKDSTFHGHLNVFTRLKNKQLELVIIPTFADPFENKLFISWHTFLDFWKNSYNFLQFSYPCDREVFY